MKKLLTAGIAGAFALALALPALAQGANQEITTAHAHAVMAENADTVKMAHTHLHHVINCLVDSDEAAFDAAAGTPCKGMGDGALDDVDNNPALHGKLEAALAAAKKGLEADSLAAVHEAAAKAAAALQVTPVQQSSGGYSW